MAKFLSTWQMDSGTFDAFMKSPKFGRKPVNTARNQIKNILDTAPFRTQVSMSFTKDEPVPALSGLGNYKVKYRTRKVEANGTRRIQFVKVPVNS
jgi:nucleoid DNA-binding protein